MGGSVRTARVRLGRHDRPRPRARALRLAVVARRGPAPHAAGGRRARPGGHGLRRGRAHDQRRRALAAGVVALGAPGRHQLRQRLQRRRPRAPTIPAAGSARSAWSAGASAARGGEAGRAAVVRRRRRGRARRSPLAVGLELLVVGAAAFAAGWFYTGGPHPYGYYGFGEVFVFVFFGLVATVGSAYVQTDELCRRCRSSRSIPVGLLGDRAAGDQQPPRHPRRHRVGQADAGGAASATPAPGGSTSAARRRVRCSRSSPAASIARRRRRPHRHRARPPAGARGARGAAGPALIPVLGATAGSQLQLVTADLLARADVWLDQRLSATDRQRPWSASQRLDGGEEARRAARGGRRGRRPR